MLFPGALLALMAGELCYPYDRPLLITWLLPLAVSVALLTTYFKIQREGSRKRIAEPLEHHPDC